MPKLPIKKPDLFIYSPHSDPMLLVDEVTDYSIPESTIRTRVFITTRSQFLDSNTNSIPVWVGFEYVAQSIAILAGIRSREESEEPKIGFVLSIRDFSSECEGFTPGDVVDISTSETMRSDDVAVFSGSISKNGLPAGTLTINTIQASEDLVKELKV